MTGNVRPSGNRRESIPSLLRILGLGFGIAIVVGGTVGQGILRTPGIVAGSLHDGHLILAMWAAGGLVSLIDSLSISELAASVPASGGPYAFVRQAFGPFVGTLAGWIDWLAQTATASFIAIVFGECLHRLGLLAAVPNGLVAGALLALLSLFHLGGTHRSGLSQQVGSAVKGTILLAITVALFTAARAHAAPLVAAPVGAVAVVAAFRAVYATYGGWNTAAYFCEEVRDPGRSVPRAILGGLVIVTLLYMLVNAALLHVLPLAAFGASTLPVADSARIALGANGYLLVAATAAIVVLTVENTQLMFTPRVLHGMARDGLVPAGLARVSSTGVPSVALLATTALAVVLVSSGAYDRLLAIYAPLSTATNALVNLAAIRMRRKRPELRRPFRMPLFPLPAVAALLVNTALTAMFIASDFADARYALLLAAPAIPLYYLRRRRAAADAALTTR